ncbi:hypothetical protein, partial [Pseudomonas sp. Nvir]
LTGTEDAAATLASDRAIGNTPSLSLLLRYLQLLDPLVNQLTLVGQVLVGVRLAALGVLWHSGFMD